MSNELRAMTASDSQSDTLSAESGELAAMQSAAGANRVGITTLIHRSLRGRYWLVIPLSILFGAAGAACGWKLFYPKFRSVAQIQLQSKVPTVNPNEQPDYLKSLDMYDEVVNTQLPIILSQRVIGDAMHDKLWQATQRGADEEAMKKFIENLTVEHPAHTQSIDIALLDRDPAIAAAGVQAVVKTYTGYYIDKDKKVLEALLKSLEDKVAAKKHDITATENQKAEYSHAYGTDQIDAIVKSEQDQWSNLQATRNKLNSYLDRMKSGDSPAQPIDELTDVQIGMVYPPMQAKLDALADAQKKLAQIKSQYLENHPAVAKAQAEAQAAADTVSEYARQYRSLLKRFAAQGLNAVDQGEQHDDNSPMAMALKLAMRPEALRKEIDQLDAQIVERHDAMARATETLQQVTRKNEEIKSLNDELHDAQNELNTFRNEYTRGLLRMVVLNAGEIPIQPFKDPRKFASAGLGVAGFLLPVFFFMWIGFMDRRLRFSEQAGRDDSGLPPLLGILPTLPDQMNDPEQAAVAAHCVHQIRIMLQVSANGGPHALPQRKAYVVTSASPRDGKTSLTMALGLSYAASGSRTLVIDCDMVGQGLTNRLKANSTEGLLEALHASTLAGRVKKTTTPHLFILPIGNAERAHASAISPAGIRKLLVEARKIFDVIIVDTGPILGSLEAQVVTAAADNVILTIARGQQQPLVQKALRMLRQINAQVAGMVFNRAQQKDFENSVTSSSFKSIGTTPPTRKTLLSEGAEESRFGPLARSVASFMPAQPPPQKPVVTKPAVKPVAPADQIHVQVVSRMVESPACEDTVFGEAAPEHDAEE